ncbi:hypothetical protein EJB05_51046, partial [Eragrostis curvula]
MRSSGPPRARPRCWAAAPKVVRWAAGTRLTESHMKNIKPFNGIDFPLWKEKVQDILKSLELDYEKDNKFAKRIIKRSISEGIKGEFDDNEDTTASELFFLIELEHKRVSTWFLFTRLTTLRYDGYSGIVKVDDGT